MRFRPFISLALSAGISWQCCLGVTSVTSGVEMLIQKARSLEARNRVDLAAQVWQQVLITNPEQPDALAGLARWCKQSGNIREENAYLTRLKRVNPDSPALISLRQPGLQQKDNARLAKAAQLSAEQHYEEAMQIYTEVFGEHPPAGGWALAYYQTEAQIPGRAEAALRALRQLAQQYPNVPDYRFAIGSLLTYRPETRHAGITELESIDTNSPMGRKAQQAWRQALVWEQQNPAYAVDMQKYLTRYPDAQLSAALENVRSLVKSHAANTSLDAAAQPGYTALKQGLFQQSEADFRSALEKNPKNSRALAGIGFIHMKAGAFTDAVVDFQQAVTYDPSNKDLQDALRSARFWAAMQRAANAAKQNNWATVIEEYRSALALRSRQPDALRGLAGAYLRTKDSSLALRTSEELIQIQPDNADNWQLCLAAENQINAKAAEEKLAGVPRAVLHKLSAKPEFQILQASIEAGAGRPEAARDILRRLNSLETLSEGAKAELADVQVQVGDFASALPALRELVAREPERADAWESLISALVVAHEPEEAELTLSRMPGRMQESLFQHPGFLQSVASMDQSLGNTQKAIEELTKIVELPRASVNEEARINAHIQLALLLSKSGSLERSEEILKTVLTSRPDDDAAWKAYAAVLGEHQQYEKIVTAFRTMPPSVAFRLTHDTDMVSIWAGAENKTGNADQAILLLQNQRQYLKRQGNSVPASLQIQLGWLLLNEPGQENELYRLLEEQHGSAELTAAQKKEISNIWVTWILRAAQTAKEQGQPARAQQILEQGITAFPQDRHLLAAYAGSLLQRGDVKRAFNAYSNWGLEGASASDYAGAIGAALTEHNVQYADDWIATGLTHWPTDPTLLQLAGDRAKAKGDFKRAEQYWKEALNIRQVNAPVSVAPSLQMLLTGNESGMEKDGAMPVNSRDAAFSQIDDAGNGAGSVRLRSALFTPNAERSSVAPVQGAPMASSFLDPATVSGRNRAAGLNTAETNLSPTDELTNRIEGVESRNTPFLTSGVSVGGRNGQAGFDHLMVEQADFEASTTLANDVRVTLAAKPTYLEGGTPDGQSTLRFGTLDAGKTFGLQTASGLAADAQISSANYGLHIGTSPYGFRTKNVIGGLRLDPSNGPVTFLLERDSVKDTLLSYAGARDPLTNSVWGGVVADTAAVQGHWGDEQSGLYASTGYQLLSGKNVAGNHAITGNLGSYWKVLSRKHDGLTIGVNFSAMHYDKNLRYFTLGQGGYFSPQQYFLFGIPFHWTGTYNQRLQYSVGGSIGVQHFNEDSSAFFPDDAARQALSGKFYPAFASTGANFSFDARLSYQLAPQWFAGVFLETSNARNYTSTSSGFFVKYTFESRPLAFTNTSVPSVPDWRGQQPFSFF